MGACSRGWSDSEGTSERVNMCSQVGQTQEGVGVWGGGDHVGGKLLEGRWSQGGMTN